MGDGEAKGATEFAAEYTELAARMVKALSRADEAETPWPVSTSFVASHDIVAIIGNLPGSDEDSAEVALAGCVLVSLPCDRVEQLADALDDVDVPYAALGQVGGDHIIVAGVPSNETYVDLALSEL